MNRNFTCERDAVDYLNAKVTYCQIQQVRPSQPEFTVSMDRSCRWSDAEDAIREGREALPFFFSAGFLKRGTVALYNSIFDKMEAEFGSYDAYCAQEKARAV